MYVSGIGVCSAAVYSFDSPSVTGSPPQSGGPGEAKQPGLICYL